MTSAELLGDVGLILFLFAGLALAVIVFTRLALLLEARLRARRALHAFGPETARAQEQGAANALGYDVTGQFWRDPNGSRQR